MDTLRMLMPLIRPQLRRLLLGLVGMSIFTLLSLLPPLLLRYLINEVVAARQWQLLLSTVALIISVPAISAAVQFFNTRIIQLAGYRLISSMRMSIYEKVMNLSMRYHTDNSSGVIVNRLMDDVNMMMYLVTGETVTILVDLIVFIFSVSIVFSLSPPLAGMIFGVLVLYVLAYRHFASRIHSASRSFRERHDMISERLQETVAGVRQVRIYNREENENRLFLQRTAESLKFRLISNVNSVSLSTVCNLVAGFGSAAIAGVGAYLVLLGRMQYGDVVAINTYIWMALTPAIRLTSLAGQLTETLVSVNRVAEILDEKDDIESPPGAPSMPRLQGRLELKDVVFGYAPDSPLYKGVSLQVEPGMTVALVGHTGCGKTTFTQLLMRYWDIQGGQILIDGHDIRSVSLRSLRELFGVVLQSPVIFDGTLAENIAYGRPQATRLEIENAARAAEIYSLADRLPDGLDAKLGTQGVRLSLGEKQRVSIARALLCDPLIMVMDEATSSLDSESEALIQKALARLLAGRTSFVVAHRLSTITTADMIVVMDAGAIVEHGVHADLMAIPDGHYRHLYEELRSAGRREEA